jgi:ferredoxin
VSFRVGPDCDGCDMCRPACPRGAIRVTGGAVAYEVVSLNCNDCGKCAVVCRQHALAPDPEWAVCWDRGCPLSSSRYEDWGCAEGRRRCTECGNSLWKPPNGDGWVCTRCDLGSKLMCPKARKASRLESAATDAPRPDGPPEQITGAG